MSAGKGRHLLGYLQMEEKDGAFRGVALVTDPRGIPMDFRYTEPVRPTRLERILYGGALDVYLREEVILENLIQSVEAKPNLWLVTDRELLRPVLRVSKIPTLRIESVSRAPLDQTGQLEQQSNEKGAFLLQADAISSPLRLEFPDELVSQAPQYAQLLTEAAEEMELLEPFIRMGKALDAITEAETSA